MGGNSLLEAFATLTGSRCPRNTLQFDNFRTFTGFLGNVIASNFTAQHVIRSDVAYHFAFRSSTVKGDNRNICLIRHLHGVTYSVGISRVDKQQFGTAYR